MKTYLVTGGAGFIGSNFIHYIFDAHKEDVKVINVDVCTYAANPSTIKEELKNPSH